MIDITSANATVALSAESLFTVNLEQFGADSSFASDAQQMAETRMGVDGHLVAGYTPAVKTVTITLEPSSPSLTFLQLLKQAQETNMKPYECQMVISVPSITQFCEAALIAFIFAAHASRVRLPMLRR